MLNIEQNAELTKNLVYFLSADGEVNTLMALRGGAEHPLLPCHPL